MLAAKEKKMKIKYIILAIICLSMIVLSGCGNQQIFDITYKFNYAEIMKSDGTIIKGKVDTWKDYEDSDMVQVVIDGVTYYTHGSNVLLIADGR
jgi:hypothetical protein